MAPSTSTLPGPRGYPLLGCVPAFRRDMLGFLTSCAREYGDLAAFRLGPRRHVLVSDPALIHQILVTDNQDYVKPYNYQFLRPAIGNGLLLNEGKAWLRQRRLMQPHFVRQKLAYYAPATVALTRALCAGWRDGERRDAHADMIRLTLQVISGAVLGADVAGQAEVIDRGMEVLQEDFKFRLESGLDLPRWLPTPGHLRLRRAVRELGHVITAMIAERRTEPGAHDDLLDRLVQDRDADADGMSEQQLRDEVLTMLLAGHETTANTLAWALALLGQHPAVEEAVTAEIQSAFLDGTPTAEVLTQLPLTERVLLETLRLYPTAYLIGRRAVRDVTLAGRRLSAGTTLFLSQWVVHRDPRHFDRPEEFRPERWESGGRSLPGRAYFPFGAGPRVCIGSHFAAMEVMLILGTLLPRCRLEPATAALPAPWPSVTLRPRDGVPVVVRRRNGGFLTHPQPPEMTEAAGAF